MSNSCFFDLYSLLIAAKIAEQKMCTAVFPWTKMCFFVSLPGNFVQGYKTVFNFITSMIEAVKGDIISRVYIRSSCYSI